MTVLHRLFATACVITLGVGLAGPSPAAGPNAESKLILHLVEAEDTRPGCYSHGVTTHGDVVTAGEVGKTYLLYVLVANVDTTQGIAGLQFGLSYDGDEESGIEILDWQECSLYQFHLADWPGADTGVLLTWSQTSDCQRVPVVVAGYFTLTAHSPDRLKLIPRPVDGLARVAACGIRATNAAELLDDIKDANLGWIDIGGGDGYNPWDPEQNLETVQKRLKRRVDD